MDNDDEQTSESTPQPSDHIEQRAPLRQEILRLIERYRSDDEEPPFTAAEMIVMAIICSEDYELTHMRVLGFIIKTFRYYSHRVVDEYLKVGETGCVYEMDDLVERNDCVVDDFFPSFRTYGLPLITTAFDPDDAPSAFTVDLPAARIFFASYFEPPRKGTFEFLRLPPEIRNTIYEMLFTLSGSWFQVYLGNGVQAYTVSWIRHYGSRWQSEDEDEGLHFPNPGKLLSLLATCKQINREASPIFYNVNRFDLPEGLSAVHALSCRLTSERFQAITALSIAISPDTNLARDAKVLADHKPLKFLAFWFNGADGWVDMSPFHRKQYFNRTTKFKHPGQIPGIGSLVVAAAAAEKFRIRGDCPKLKVHFKQEIARIKTQGPSSSKSKKRVKKQTKKSQDPTSAPRENHKAATKSES